MNAKPLLRHAVTADFTAIRALLSAAGLPSEDLGEAQAEFLVVEEKQTLIGAGALERLSPEEGLLRSLVVAPEWRGKSIGAALFRQLLAEARVQKMRDLYLLTTSAVGFFSVRGFSPIPREKAPESVRSHPQFAGVCPKSATLMHRSLRSE